MKYLIRQKIFSLTDRFSIRDEFENDRFYVNGEFFAIGKKLHLEDTKGNVLYFIKQKLFNFLPVYEIYVGELLYATLRKKFTFLKPKIEIDQNGTPYYISGDTWSHEFTISRNDTPIASISKKWFAFADTYGVEIIGHENEAFIIAMVICIDEIIYSGIK
jgi:uncharacterized protein YxjI